MKEGRKRAVSVRLTAADIRKIKKLAQRLDARDTDIIRFAIKTTLARLAPLQDSAARGVGLIPVLVEFGPELLQHFELDSVRLEELVNAGATESQRVDSDDIALLAMSGAQQNYALVRLRGPEKEAAAGDDREATLRHYFYQKYSRRPPARRHEESQDAERRGNA